MGPSLPLFSFSGVSVRPRTTLYVGLSMLPPIAPTLLQIPILSRQVPGCHRCGGILGFLTWCSSSSKDLEQLRACMYIKVRHSSRTVVQRPHSSLSNSIPAALTQTTQTLWTTVMKHSITSPSLVSQPRNGRVYRLEDNVSIPVDPSTRSSLVNNQTDEQKK